MHRSHEYLAKVAIEICDGVLIHSLLGNLKPGDIPADVRTRAIARAGRELFRAGDRGAGRLPAGHALRRPARGAAARAVPPELRLLAPDRRPRPRRRRQLLRARSTRTTSSTRSRRARCETQPLKIDWTFWCYKCGGMASGAHLPARRRGPAAGLRHEAAQVAVRRRSRCRPSSAGPEVLEILRAVLRRVGRRSGWRDRVRRDEAHENLHRFGQPRPRRRAARRRCARRKPRAPRR